MRRGGRGVCRTRRRGRVWRRWGGLDLLGVWHRANFWHCEACLHRWRFGRLAGFAQPLPGRGARLAGGGTGIRCGRGCIRRRCRGHGGYCWFGLRVIGWLRHRRRRGRRRCRHGRKARTQFLIAILRVRAVGDQALRQFLPFGRGQCPVGRRRHRSEVRIIRRLSGGRDRSCLRPSNHARSRPDCTRRALEPRPEWRAGAPRTERNGVCPSS